MQHPIYDYIIVGAGITGLALANQLRQFNSDLNILILEKSKSVGGRMATRRIGDSKFDHGAQYIRQTEDSKKIIEFWKSQNLITNFYVDNTDRNKSSTYGSQFGMNQLCKSFAANIGIHFNIKVSKIIKKNTNWQLEIEGSELFYNSLYLILTCPLPQALDILKVSELQFSNQLLQINYSKAVVFMVQFKSELQMLENYIENADDKIFSICSQKAKGMTSYPDFTFVMTESCSEEWFFKNDDELQKIFINLLNSKFQNTEINKIEIKKWKYSLPQKIWQNPFIEIESALYLAGDAFGGPSLNGSIKSANNLFQYLSNQLN